MIGALSTLFATLIIVGVLAMIVRSGDTHADVEITGGTLRVVPVGKAKFLAMRGSRSVPLSSVTKVETADDFASLGVGFRTGGSAFPGVVWAGNFRSGKRGRAWLVVGKGRPVVVVTIDGPIKRFIFSADDPRATVTKIQRVTSAA